MAQKKPILLTNNIQRKEFSYELGPISLKFTLRTDIKSEMKGFLELVERAAKDLKEELEKVGK